MAGHSISSMCIGFGLITFGVSVVYDFLLRMVFKVKTAGKQYTLGKWIAITMGLILVIGVANFLFLSYAMGVPLSGLGNMIFSTFLVGLFPLVFMGSYAVRQGEKKYGAIADDINQRAQVATNSTFQIFGIDSDNIRYIEAMQNYIRIWYIDHNTLSQITERATLSTIEVELVSSSLKRCHRSYIVNTSAILTATGNAQGLQLKLKGVDETVPVSRKYVDAFR